MRETGQELTPFWLERPKWHLCRLAELRPVSRRQQNQESLRVRVHFSYRCSHLVSCPGLGSSPLLRSGHETSSHWPMDV